MADLGRKRKPRVCMIVQQRDVKGGIAAVTNGYYGSILERKYNIRYVESYCDGSKLKKLLKAIDGYIKFALVLRNFRPELVHIHSSFGPSFYRMQPFLYMAKRRGIPVVDHCHGADFDSFFVEASDKKKKSIRKVFSRFDKIIVLSQEWREKFLEVVPDEKLTVIQNYCKPKNVEEISAWTGERFEARRVVFLGELGERKGGFDFADIVKNTKELLPDVSFVFCGDGAKEDVERIRSEVEEARESALVSFPGWVRGDKKDSILRESSVFLLPSYQEGQPMSILDAMAYGLPIVSTEVGGIPQLVNNGENGYLTKPGDAKGFAEGIAALLSDSDKYSAACRKSLEIANERYGFEAHAKKLSAVYDEALGRK